MNNLNGNEVYYYFNGDSFKTNQQSVGTINQGDIYLYQTNCLVLFYKTFTTSYSYTKIGKVINPEGLDTLIGSSNVEVMWFIKSDTEENPKDSSSDNVDSTDNNAKIRDTKKINNEDEDKEGNNFDNYGFERFLRLRLNNYKFLYDIIILLSLIYIYFNINIYNLFFIVHCLAVSLFDDITIIKFTRIYILITIVIRYIIILLIQPN